MPIKKQKTIKKKKKRSHLVTKRSFRHYLNPASNQITSFTKVIHFGSLITEMS
jgi:hypothetical protein